MLHRSGLTAVLVALLAAFCGARAASAQEVTTPARQALLVDFHTGSVLFAKAPDELMAPASMSKLMTVYMVLERLADGRLAMKDEFTVSEKAWKMGGSKMFVEVGSSVTVEDLLRGIIVQSGNDACIVVAEALAASEEAFADQMTQRAHELGLTDSTFRNASGWPDPQHLTTARDLARLAELLIRNFPEQYKLFAEKTFEFSGIKQPNRNPLLYKSLGADGLKTGHTEASGYGLVASAVQGDRRLILVLNGLESVNQRSRESERLLSWGFREFTTVHMFEPGETVESAEVWLGAEPEVALVLQEPLALTIHRKARDDMQVSVIYDGPVPAPIEAGTAVALLRIAAPGMETVERPLLAGAAVPRLGFLGRIGAAAMHLVWGVAVPQ